LNALLQGEAADKHLAEHLVLIAAAVPSNSLAKGGEFDRKRIAAMKISILSSLHDNTLKGFWKAEAVATCKPFGPFPTALGLKGPEQLLPPGDDHIDVSGSVGGHSPAKALTSSDVQEVLRKAARCRLPAPMTLLDVSQDARSSLQDEDEACVILEDDAEQEKQCPGPAGHKLIQYVTTDDHMICDFCEQRCGKGVQLWGCRSCDYDVCEHCYYS